VTRHDGVVTLTGGEVAPERKKGGDEANWVDGSKNNVELIIFKKTYVTEI
jgi:hypothetical protein